MKKLTTYLFAAFVLSIFIMNKDLWCGGVISSLSMSDDDQFLERTKRERQAELENFDFRVNKQLARDAMKKGIKKNLKYAKLLVELEEAGNLTEDQSLKRLRQYLQNAPISPKAQFLLDLSTKGWNLDHISRYREQLSFFYMLNQYSPGFLYQAGFLSIDELPERLSVQEGNALLKYVLNNPEQALEYYIHRNKYQNFLDALLWHSASAGCNENIVKLLKYGAVAIVPPHGEMRNSALMAALNGKKYGAAKEIVYGQDHIIHEADRAGFTPLMCAASQGSMDLVGLLLDRSAEIDARDKDGFTALAYAAFGQHIEVCRMLIDRGADKNILDSPRVRQRVRNCDDLNSFEEVVRMINEEA